MTKIKIYSQSGIVHEHLSEMTKDEIVKRITICFETENGFGYDGQCKHTMIPFNALSNSIIEVSEETENGKE